MAQIQSEHPGLEYVGYQQWLRMLLRGEGFDAKNNNVSSRLQELGLNQRSISEIQDQTTYMANEQKKRTGISRGIESVGKVVYNSMKYFLNG